MQNGPFKAVKPITLQRIVNGTIWSFTLATGVDTGGRGFIIDPDPEKPNATVAMAGSCLTLVHAVEAAEECPLRPPATSIHSEAAPVRMIPLLDLPPDLA